MTAARIPCINPACRRTASAEKFSGEIICAKCFRNLPADERAFHRRCWREIRKWERRIARTVDELKRQRMQSICEKWSWRLNYHWETAIKASFTNPQRPEGLDSFLEENGIA